MKRRLTATALFALLTASFASAQSLTASETEVNQGFANLRGADQALFHLSGNEVFGATTTPIASDLFWSRPIASTAQDMKMELIEARNGLQIHRVVADGQHVWGVDLVKNTYSTSRYGSYTATIPSDYEVNGLQSVNLLATAQSALLARMVREVWGGTISMYRPWIPASANRSEHTVMGAGDTFVDPVVTTRTYASTDTTKYHVYWVTQNGTPVRSLTWYLEYNGGTGSWDIKSIYYSDLSKRGSVNRLIDWKVDVFTGVLPSSGNFVYTPTAGSRAVAGPRPNGSG